MSQTHPQASQPRGWIDRFWYALFKRYIRWRLPAWGIHAVEQGPGDDPVRYLIPLEYPISPSPRYGYGRPPHPQLAALYQGLEHAFTDELRHLAASAPLFESALGAQAPDGLRYEPENIWFPALDAFVLFALLTERKPKRFIEVGSGNSTIIAALARQASAFPMQLTSVDPQPRAGIDALCDRVVRQPLEALDLNLFSELEPGDVLFIDNSHRCFTNSDVTVFFLDILPSLPAGVLVHIHDIFLPDDYPHTWTSRHYSEQYLLAAWLLANPERQQILLPNAYCTRAEVFAPILDTIFQTPILRRMRDHAAGFMDGRLGLSFWMLTR